MRIVTHFDARNNNLFFYFETLNKKDIVLSVGIKNENEVRDIINFFGELFDAPINLKSMEVKFKFIGTNGSESVIMADTQCEQIEIQEVKKIEFKREKESEKCCS